MGIEADSVENWKQHVHLKRLSDKDLVKSYWWSLKFFGCWSITFWPELCPKVAYDGHVTVIFPGLSASNQLHQYYKKYKRKSYLNWRFFQWYLPLLLFWSNVIYRRYCLVTFLYIETVESSHWSAYIFIGIACHSLLPTIHSPCTFLKIKKFHKKIAFLNTIV